VTGHHRGLQSAQPGAQVALLFFSQRGVDAGFGFGDVPFRQGEQQRILVGEVLVQRADADAGNGGDTVGGGVEPPPRGKSEPSPPAATRPFAANATGPAVFAVERPSSPPSWRGLEPE
jgi:hypothetical protein